MILMIEHTIESNRSLPFIGCESGLSKWLEDLSKVTSPLKSIQNLENATYLLEDSQIYELIYPAQSLMSDRLFEEISRRNEDNEPEKLRFREQDNHTKAHGSSEVTTINMLSLKEGYKTDLKKSGLHHENRKKFTGHGLKDGISQAEPDVKMSINLTEVENKFPVKSDAREKLLRNIINTYGRKIEDNQLGQGLNTLKKALQSPGPTSIERFKSTEKIRAFYKRAEDVNSSESERNSYSIEEENSPARYIKKFLSEKMSAQFSRPIEGIPASREFLEKKSGEITKSNLIESNQHSETSVSIPDYIHKPKLQNPSRDQQIPHQIMDLFGNRSTSFADYHIHDLNSLDSEKQLIENKEFNVSSGRISEQFSRPIEGISVPKRFLEEKLRGNSGQNSYFSAGNTSYKSKDLKSKSNQLSERIKNPFDRNQFDRNQFDKISVSDLKILENNRKSDILSLNSVNLLIEEAYSNSIKKSDIIEENRELLLNLIGNLSQVMNLTNRDTAPTKQNIFNINVSGESPTGENDLKNLSDSLVLILKDQARRHGIDLS